MVVIPPGHERIRTVRTYRHAELESSRITIGLSDGTANRVFRQLIILRSGKCLRPLFAQKLTDRGALF